jgi:hypothetical protein
VTALSRRLVVVEAFHCIPGEVSPSLVARKTLLVYCCPVKQFGLRHERGCCWLSSEHEETEKPRIGVTSRKGLLRTPRIVGGPGQLAMTNGWTSGNGLGLGLPGAKRLVNEFVVQSAPGRGTRVIVTHWR